MIIAVIAGAVVLSFVLSLLATSACKQLAFRFGVLDLPSANGHKAHSRAIPLLGGSAIFIAIVLPILLVLVMAKLWSSGGAPGWLPVELARHIPGAATRIPQALGILAGATLLHIMGLIDDRRHLGPWLKMIVQIIAAGFVAVFCNVRILTLLGPAGSIAVTILWLVLLTNSFNFLDNMDGLCAGVSAICAAALLGAAVGMGQWFVSGWLCLVLGATLGFLIHNFPPAKIFMGDAGSLVIGFMLAVLSCLTTYVKPGQVNILYGLLVPALAMAIPLYDTASVMIIRISEGRNPMVGDNRHFSHRLLQRGMSKRTALLTILLCTAATAIAASVLPHTTGFSPAVMLLGQTLCILMIIALLETVQKKTWNEKQ